MIKRKDILRLQEDGQYLVVGGPGTGKSGVALMRARKFHDKGNYAFLPTIKVLNSTVNQLDTNNLKLQHSSFLVL